jgi:hypothetical protein
MVSEGSLAPDQATSNPFFDHPILNSPYEPPARHWELDEHGQPTQKIKEARRRAEFITPIPQPKKRKITAAQQAFVFDEGNPGRSGLYSMRVAQPEAAAAGLALGR